MNNKIDFYQEVIVLPNSAQKQYIGQKGVVMGISEEDGIFYGYGVLIDGKKTIDFFTEDELSPTGKQFRREDFY